MMTDVDSLTTVPEGKVVSQEDQHFYSSNL